MSLIVAALLCGGQAWAQTSEADKATARQLALDGYGALEQGDYATAVDRFERADALFHAATIYVGLGRARAGLGKLVSAQDAYSRAANEPLPANSSPAMVKAVEDARREFAAISRRIPMVVVQITGASTAKVFIDDAEIPQAALGVKRPVDPGQHQIRAWARGFAPAAMQIRLAEGQVLPVALALQPGESGPEPGASAESGSGSRTLGLVGMGVGGAGIVVGIVAGTLALSKNSDLSKLCPHATCPSNSSQKSTIQSDLDSYHTLGGVSTASLIAGGVLAGGGALLWFLGPRISSPTVSPVVGAGYIGVKGSF